VLFPCVCEWIVHKLSNDSAGLRAAKRSDVELKNLMIQMLMRPFAEEWNGGYRELESRLNDLKVPYDIKRFILILHEGSPL
jgi:hypothetical protein